MFNIILVSIVILTKIQENDAIPKKKPYMVRIDYLNNKNNREQLAMIVEYINKNMVDEHEQISEEKEEYDRYNLEDVMKLQQKNYDAGLQKAKENPEVRHHVVNNPWTLKEFLNNMRQRASPPNSDDTSDTEFDRSLLNPNEVRRNAEYRVDKDESNKIKEHTNPRSYAERNWNVKLQRNMQKLWEDQVTPFKIHNTIRKKDEEGGGNNKRFQQKSKSRSETEDSWDMATVKYNWEKKPSDDRNDDTNKHWNESKENGRIRPKNKAGDNIETTNKISNKESRPPNLKKETWKGDKRWIKDGERDGETKDGWGETRNQNSNTNRGDTFKYTKEAKRDKVGKEWNVNPKDSLVDFDKTTRNSWSKKKVESYKANLARMPKYSNNGRERSDWGFLGRTSIPFVGKKAVYDDK